MRCRGKTRGCYYRRDRWIRKRPPVIPELTTRVRDDVNVCCPLARAHVRAPPIFRRPDRQLYGYRQGRALRNDYRCWRMQSVSGSNLCFFTYVYDFTRALFRDRPALTLDRDIGFAVRRKLPVFIDCVHVRTQMHILMQLCKATWDVCSVSSKDYLQIVLPPCPISIARKFLSIYN